MSEKFVIHQNISLFLWDFFETGLRYQYLRVCWACKESVICLAYNGPQLIRKHISNSVFKPLRILILQCGLKYQEIVAFHYFPTRDQNEFWQRITVDESQVKTINFFP